MAFVTSVWKHKINTLFLLDRILKHVILCPPKYVRHAATPEWSLYALFVLDAPCNYRLGVNYMALLWSKNMLLVQYTCLYQIELNLFSTPRLKLHRQLCVTMPQHWSTNDLLKLIAYLVAMVLATMATTGDYGNTFIMIMWAETVVCVSLFASRH